jgi:hypothetical protein
MKTKLITLTLALVLSASAQIMPTDAHYASKIVGATSSTNSPSIRDGFNIIIDGITSGVTNWYFVPYVSYSPDRVGSKYGGGLAALYPVSDYVTTGLRVEYTGNTVKGISGTATLQYPLTLFGKVKVVPFAYAGVNFGLSGKSYLGITIPGEPDDTVGAVTGYGASVMLYRSASGNFTLGLVGDYEQHHAYGVSQLNLGPIFNVKW